MSNGVRKDCAIGSYRFSLSGEIIIDLLLIVE